jgi:hypothetical protein
MSPDPVARVYDREVRGDAIWREISAVREVGAGPTSSARGMGESRT